jgi:hypothetical protein
MAFGLALWALNPVSLASMPLSLSAEISAVAAGKSASRSLGCRWISTSVAATDPDPGRSPWNETIPPPCIPTPSMLPGAQEAWTHPASIMAGCRSHQKSACSPLFDERPESNLVPANCRNFSVIDAVLPASTSLRDVLNVASANCASAAFWFASAARASNWANCLSPATLAFWPKNISPHTPITISSVADVPTIVSNPRYQKIPAPNSIMSPAISTYANKCARCELTSYWAPKSPSPSDINLAYIIPFVPSGRHRANGHAKIQAGMLAVTFFLGLIALVWQMLK